MDYKLLVIMMRMEPQTSLSKGTRVLKEQYESGQLAVFLWDEAGPLAELSVDMPELDLARDEFVFKLYGENAVLVSELCDSGLILPTKRFVLVGRRLCPVCRLKA